MYWQILPSRLFTTIGKEYKDRYLQRCLARVFLRETSTERHDNDISNVRSGLVWYHLNKYDKVVSEE